MLERIGSGEHGLFGALRIATVEQHIAGQPIELAEERHPFQAFLTDADGAPGYHATQYIEVIVGLVVGDDHTGALVFQ
ncbi:hypothetical protein D9M68_684200 [compost metagenome]